MGKPSAGAKRHHVVIIGSGFGGLAAAKDLKQADVDVTSHFADDHSPVPATALPGGHRNPLRGRNRSDHPAHPA